MTNQEAIEILKDILEEATETENSVCYVTSVDEEPLRMAIEALEKSNRDCVDCANFDGEYAECTAWNKTVVSVGCRYWNEVNEDD